MISPEREAAAIIGHYFKALTERTGMRWTNANQKDMDRLGQLLKAAPEASDTIAPYLAPAPAEPRTTVVLEPRERTPKEWREADPQFIAWQREQQQRRQYDDADIAEGMLRRNGGGQ